VIQQNNKKRSFCAEEIKKNAIKCKHCGEHLNEEKTKEIIPRRKYVQEKIAIFYT